MNYSYIKIKKEEKRENKTFTRHGSLVKSCGGIKNKLKSIWTDYDERMIFTERLLFTFELLSNKSGRKGKMTKIHNKLINKSFFFHFFYFVLFCKLNLKLINNHIKIINKFIEFYHFLKSKYSFKLSPNEICNFHCIFVLVCLLFIHWYIFGIFVLCLSFRLHNFNGSWTNEKRT